MNTIRPPQRPALHLVEPHPSDSPATSRPPGDVFGTVVFESVQHLTVAAEAWLASASEDPAGTLARMDADPFEALLLPCGRTFDIVELRGPAGYPVLDALCSQGPFTGPVATHAGWVLFLAEAGTANRLNSLLAWGEWAADLPRVRVHGHGETVALPPIQCRTDEPPSPLRWIIAPAIRTPALPSAPVLRRAIVHATRSRT